MNNTPAHEAAGQIDQQRSALAARISELTFERKPELLQRYGPIGRSKCLQDAEYHLRYLSEALQAERVELFVSYIAWAKALLAGYKVPKEDLAFQLECIKDAIRESLPPAGAELANGYIDQAVHSLPMFPDEVPAFVSPDKPLADLAGAYLKALIAGDRHQAGELVMEAVEKRGTPIRDIYLHVFQPAQWEVGRLWQHNKISVAQEHFCTAATQLIMSQLYPRIFSGERNGKTMIATCITDDLHEIGVRMVADFFEIEGWDSYYLGANTPIQSIIRTIIERKADLLAVSATMTYHVGRVRELISAIRKSEGCKHVKILVGGYPFNLSPELWRSVGADGSAVDANGAVKTASSLLLAS